VNRPGVVEASMLGRELPGEPSSLPSLVGVRDGYERWAPTYDGFPNPLLSREERHVAPLLPPLQNRRVLDLACGTGRWLTRLLVAGAGSGVGIDLSSAMLRVAAHKERLSGRVVEADCLRLPFRTSTFDFAICSFALGHIRDLHRVAAEVAQVMKPDSDLFVADLHLEAFARGWRTGFRDRHGAVQVDSQPYSVEDIIRAFHSGGFSCVTHVGLCLGNPEQALFARTARQHLFQAACRVPAILFSHFKRVRQPTVSQKKP
jgi:ubiquinone/menaquinone biosynthesis C-methylase UbiE